MELQQRFEEVISCGQLWQPGSKLLLAFSGGLDSVVLAHLLLQGKHRFCLAHINFGLRGAESDGDESWCRQFAANPFHNTATGGTPQKMLSIITTRFDTKHEAEQCGESIQMAARRLRYSWLRKVKREEDAAYILTAHHANDQLETVLYNFVKGAGLKGLMGMPLKTHDLVRPLLPFTRAELEEYAASERLEWREDSSNASLQYNRNTIRHEVIPILRQINPSLEKTFTATQNHRKSAWNALQWFTQNWLSQHVKITGDAEYLEFSAIESQPSKSWLVYSWLEPHDFNATQIRNLLQSEDTGKRVRSGSHEVYREHDCLVLRERIFTRIAVDEFLEDSLEGIVNFADGTSLSWNKERCSEVWKTGHHEALFDAATLKWPLHVRSRQSGDRIKPLGMDGKSSLVSDVVTDSKLPLPEKEQIKVLCSGDEIFWVIGLKVSETGRLTSNTRFVYRFRYKKAAWTDGETA